MSQTIRAKMRCTNQADAGPQHAKDADGLYTAEVIGRLYTYTLEAQYDPDPGSENSAFWDATPAGKVELTCVLDQGWEVGRLYYVDFTLAPDDANDQTES